MNALVDNGACGHSFDDAIIPRLCSRLDGNKVLPNKMSTAGGGN